MQALRRVVLRFPLTFAVVCALLVIGVVSQGLWRSVEDASWFDSVAYGVPAFQEGRWWTVLLGPWFGLTPAQNISLILLVGVGLGVGEWRLGSRRTALTAAAGQLVGVLGTCAFLALGRSVEWEWAAKVAEALDVGCTTAVVAVLAASTATVKSPWRLRTRILLCSYVIVSFLFLGRFADLTHLFAFATFLLAGEKWFSRSERGVRPRTRREARLVAAFGVWLIAVVHIVVYFFPGSGPFGPTSAHQASAWSTVFSVVVAGVLGEFLRRGRRWAWRLTVFYAISAAVLTLVVLILVVVNDFESVGAVTAGTGLLWAGEAVLLIAGRSAFTVPWRRRVDGARDSGGDVIEDVKSSIRRHGGSTMSWMITWDGMNYYFGAQNNGVIQLTGVASRYVAYFIAGLLVLLGLFPMIGAVLQLMPKPVLGGATLIMFGTVAVAGIRILAEAGLHRRNVLIVAISLGMGLGVAAVPEVLRELPKALHNIFESPITVGAFCAIVLNIFLPEEFIELEEDEFDPEASTLKVMQDPDVTK